MSIREQAPEPDSLDSCALGLSQGVNMTMLLEKPYMSSCHSPVQLSLGSWGRQPVSRKWYVGNLVHEEVMPVLAWEHQWVMTSLGSWGWRDQPL